MLRTLPQRSTTAAWYASASVRKHGTALQQFKSFSHSATRTKQKQSLTFKKPSDMAQTPVSMTFNKPPQAPNQPETRSQRMKRIAVRERALVSAGLKSRRDMFNTSKKEVEQWERENPEAAAAYDRRFTIGLVIFLLPWAVYSTGWTMRWIPYGWPGGIRERHEETRSKILRFFGREESHEPQIQIDSTLAEGGEVDETYVND